MTEIGEKMRAFVFPGQGSGVTEPGAELLPRIRRVVGERIPDQVKLFARAAQDADESRALQVRPDVVAGHSLGEYGAAYAAGCFDFETGLWLVAERDRFLAEADEKRRAGWLRSSGPTPRRSRERSARRRARWSQTTTPRARPSSQACATPWATRSPGSGAARCPSTSPSRHTRPTWRLPARRCAGSSTPSSSASRRFRS